MTRVPAAGEHDAAMPEPVLATVVLAEDHPQVRELLRLYLQAAGFDVIAAADGQEALELVGRVQPVALVTDLIMPRLDGDQLIARLRSQPATARLPVLVVTAVGHGHSRLAELTRLPLVGILTKPPIWTRIVPELCRLIERAG